MKSRAGPLVVAVVIWLLLYFVLAESVYLLIRNDLSRFWSVIPSTLLYLIPAYVLARYSEYRWIYSGVGVGCIGVLAWLLHSQFLFMGTIPYIHILGDISVAILGAWLGHKAKLRRPSNDSSKLTHPEQDVPYRHVP